MWSTVMVGKLVIALAAAAAVIAGTTMTASANGHGGFRAGFVARPHRFVFHHFPFIDRFALYGGMGYPYTEDCFAPLRTPWGWRWRYMCY